MMKLSNYKLIMFALVVLLLFQFYFAFYYLLGEGASNGSPIMGLLSFDFSFYRHCDNVVNTTLF